MRAITNEGRPSPGSFRYTARINRHAEHAMHHRRRLGTGGARGGPRRSDQAASSSGASGGPSGGTNVGGATTGAAGIGRWDWAQADLVSLVVAEASSAWFRALLPLAMEGKAVAEDVSVSTPERTDACSNYFRSSTQLFPVSCRFLGVSTPRPVVKGRTILVTRRCILRQFLLLPDDKINQAILYCLGVASQDFGVELHAFIAESNHHHGEYGDPFGNLPDFLRNFHQLLAKCVNGGAAAGETCGPMSRRPSSSACSPKTPSTR